MHVRVEDPAAGAGRRCRREVSPSDTCRRCAVADKATRYELLSEIVTVARSLGWRNKMAETRPGEVAIVFTCDDEPSDVVDWRHSSD